IGMWMMPDNGSKGNLEDLLLGACSNQDALKHAEAAVLVGQDLIGLSEQKRKGLRSKATINCYKSLGLLPDRPYGHNFTSNGVFDPSAPAFQPYAEWLVAVLGL